MRRINFTSVAFAALALTATSAILEIGCGVDNSVVGGACAPGYVECEGQCIRVDSDPANCGACGHSCGTGASCNESVCSDVDAASSLPDGSSRFYGDGGLLTEAGVGSNDDGSPGNDGSFVDDGSTEGGSGSDGGSGSEGGTDPDASAGSDGGFGSEAGLGSDGGSSGGSDSGSGNGSDSGSGSDGGGSSGSDSGSGNGADGGSTVDSGSGCSGSFISCDGQCIDGTRDPYNCGACGKVCPSNSCVNSQCIGTAAGHIVAIGHDYEVMPAQTSSQAQALGNAVFIGKSNPLNVLSYEQYAPTNDVLNVRSLLLSQSNKVGRTLAFTTASLSTDVSSNLDITTYDVLLIPDQSAAVSGALGTIGNSWASSSVVLNFLHAGGVVVVLDGGAGTGEMPNFMNALGILTVNAHTVLTAPSLTVFAPGDAVGSGLTSPYVPTKSTSWFDTEAASGTVTYVVGASSTQPVVVHKVLP